MVLLLLLLLHLRKVILVVLFVLLQEHFALVVERREPLVITSFRTAVVATLNASTGSLLGVTAILALIRLPLGLLVS